METNNVITIIYQQLLPYSERKVMIYRILFSWILDAAFLHIMEFP